jgi:cyclophilin family peptidyl-prolyl cis-trans isomerase/HEAT repeat protein
MIRLKTIFALFAVPLGAAAQQDFQLPTPGDTETLMAVWEAEDRRGTGTGMRVILDALQHEDDRMRAIALRSLGRLERPNLVSAIAPMLDDNVADVRIAAADAIAQSVLNQNTELATRELANRLESETDKRVRASLVASLGRLPYESSDRIAFVESVMQRNSVWDDPRLTLNIARGWDSFARRVGRRHQFSARAIGIMDSLATFVATSPGRARRINDLAGIGADIREMGVAALTATGSMDTTRVARTLSDASWEVRRAGVMALRTFDAVPEGALAAGLRDDHFSVRIEALGVYGRGDPSTLPCGPLVGATADDVAAVALVAIDLLATGCSEREPAVSRLSAIAAQPIEGDRWHAPAHALLSLATLSPDWARSNVRTFAAHSLWWVRLYAARAADKLDAVGLLEQLAYDDHDNVRQAALSALTRIVGHAADELLILNLKRSDYQLVLTAARGLEGTSSAEALPALFEALFRITSEGRQTSRDPRKAIVDRINELGNAGVAGALRPYLRDFDPVIALTVSDILERWTGERLDAYPAPMNRAFPEFNDIRRLDGIRVRVQMSRGGEFTFRLFGRDAPTNVARFLYLATERHFDLLTFHRVVPNFVIQGGSPGANEYVADGPYTNDEITDRAHARGTVGLSTRGRDTADSQIFVNLVDNRRLDYNYTIIGEVISGMDVIDGILEGDIIQRVDVGR